MAVATQAQNRQSALDQLDNLGASRKDYDEANVMTAGEKDVASFIERVQANINSSGMVITGNIADMSIQVTEDEIRVLGNAYLSYQDKGVKGSKDGSKAPNSPYSYKDKKPPLQVFIDYVKAKNLILRNSEDLAGKLSPFEDTTAEDDIKTLAILIQKKVYEYGFKPRNVFAKEIPKLKNDLKKSIKGFGKDAIKEVFKFNK